MTDPTPHEVAIEYAATIMYEQDAAQNPSMVMDFDRAATRTRNLYLRRTTVAVEAYCKAMESDRAAERNPRDAEDPR